jgi:hypothetical protein
MRKCAFPECDEFGTQRLPDLQLTDPSHIWCKRHAETVRKTTSRRDYEDFIQELKQQGITGDPIFVASDWTETDQGWTMNRQNRTCFAPGCQGEAVMPFSFEPHRKPGWVFGCKDHQKVLRHVADRFNGLRILDERQAQSATEVVDSKTRKNGIRDREIFRLFIENGGLKPGPKAKGNMTYLIALGLDEKGVPIPSDWADELEAQKVREVQRNWVACYGNRRPPIALPGKKSSLHRLAESLINRVIRGKLRNRDSALQAKIACQKINS